MNINIIKAIFLRDFVSYFSNPTGYVFICVFVMLSSLAAFWPPEFFSNNLANLDQLSTWMPFILVIFIPAITMSVWSEERRQGTDELLLTLPASDFDVVLGKFKAGVAIFTVALLFSMFSIWLVFAWGLGNPDLGLFAATYLGYWFMGIALLSVGMVASFLTSNLTVGFVLGVIFSSPIALSGVADWVIKDPGVAETIRAWSAVEQFSNFARGVLSLRSMSYFIGVAAAMLYICMVLIGRRHWSGGEGSESRSLHYLMRTLSIVAIVLGVNTMLSNNDSYTDMTAEGTNTLSPSTKRLVKELAANKDISPIRVDAYVSPQMPAEYAGQKRELLSTLEELSSISGGRIQVVKHEIETFSPDATRAEQAYGIEPRDVSIKSRGARSLKSVFLGAAFTCGLDKVVVPFLDKGIPVEYELIRSITTVAQQKRKRVGVVKTSVNLSGNGFSLQGPSAEAQLIAELKKQYEITEVDPLNAITEKFDVLLAMQPSSLGPEAMDNFVAAVKTGQPTAIFEDPFPIPSLHPDVPGTNAPKRSGGGLMEMLHPGASNEPKGDINQLWRLLGVRIDGANTVFQDYLPYPQAGSFTDANWVFVDEGNGAAQPMSSESEITAGLDQMLFLFPGAIERADGAKTEMHPLAVTGGASGVSRVSDLRSRNAALRRQATGQAYVLAAKITGAPPAEVETPLDDVVSDDDLIAEQQQTEEGSAEEALASSDAKEKKETPDLNVVLVSDIDIIADAFFAIRQSGNDSDALLEWRFQNVVFVLNILDELASDDRYLAVRKRTRDYRQLTTFNEATQEYRDKTLDEIERFRDDATEEINKTQQEFIQKITQIESRTDLTRQEKQIKLEDARIRFERKRGVDVAKLEKQRDRKIELSNRDLDLKVKGDQDFFKMAAVLLPPILPILLALLVFFHRRSLEKEGVSQQRLRFGGASASATSDAA